jgi:hypothetical protein
MLCKLYEIHFNIKILHEKIFLFSCQLWELLAPVIRGLSVMHSQSKYPAHAYIEYSYRVCVYSYYYVYIDCRPTDTSPYVCSSIYDIDSLRWNVRNIMSYIIIICRTKIIKITFNRLCAKCTGLRPFPLKPTFFRCYSCFPYFRVGHLNVIYLIQATPVILETAPNG